MTNKTKKVLYIVYMPNGMSAKEAETKGYVLPYSASQVRKLLQRSLSFITRTKEVPI
jgi:hypothetical protein